ncbi:LysR substrate-binding domain-containing protein [Paracidovorax citrulli]
MQDLNDLSLYAEVVRHGSFSAASRATGVPKSRLSRRIAQLEKSLGAQLLLRTTRQVRVTPLGQAFYERCNAMLAEAKAAREVIERSREQPGGELRIACPWGIAQTLMAPAIARFMAENPGVRIELDASNRRVDVIAEGFDLALRVRDVLDDSSLAIRTFGESQWVLVASPALLDTIGRPRTPAALDGVPGVGLKPHDGKHVWQMRQGNEPAIQVHYDPRLVTDEFSVLLAAAVEGIGVAMLPAMYCREALDRGELEPLLTHWRLPVGTFHAVFPSREGMPPALRRFLDFLADYLPENARRAGLRPVQPLGAAQPPLV